MKPLLLLLAMMASTAFATPIRLAPADAARVGQLVWKNECAGTVEGLVSWNKGENFPSLGIGHFIWYPKGVRGPFEESFPGLVRLLQARGVAVPQWAQGPAPWADAAAMKADPRRVAELRALLSRKEVIGLQTEHLIARLNAALPKMLEAAPAADRARVKARFEAVAASPEGCFALIDYVNFKGEGTAPTERYKGQGWGLLQVLQGMSGKGDPARDFGASAAKVLSQRVKNAPPERKESRWLPGWHNRVNRYGSAL